MRLLRVILAAMFAVFCLGSASAQDRHSGYYYPEPRTFEVYNSPTPALSGVNKKSRVGLIAGINKRHLERPYDPGYHIFAKGADSEKLIIVSTADGRYDTLFRLRALLAGLSSEARLSPLFSNTGAPEDLNFLDLLKMGGFVMVTISDGREMAHQIDIK